METFIHDDFLLNNEPAKILFHNYAKEMPIIDYHCHLPPKEIVENKPFKNMTEVWLKDDHYKWRVMRSAGVDEKYITGNGSDYEKFQAWAKTVPKTIGNPLYQWTHLELKRYFNINTLLNEDSCKEVWEHCNQVLAEGNLSPLSIIKQSNVKMIGTTDHPLDTLDYHKALKNNDDIQVKVWPSFRPDEALDIQPASFIRFVEKLGNVTNGTILSLDQFLDAMKERIHYFHEVGCRISDHGFEYLVYKQATFEEASLIFEKRQNGEAIANYEAEQFTTFIMMFLGRHYSELDWAMQLHVGALRNTNQRMYEKIGPNTGFDSIGEADLAKPLNQFLNALDRDNHLPKTIIYNLNPTQNYIVATAVGNFQSPHISGKIQFGSGWWFNDQKEGIVRQITDAANTGMLSHFVGMLTDSRSFFSYTRHDYFRRILCNLFGEWMERGEVPMDYKLMGGLVQDISYNNARDYLMSPFEQKS